MLSYSKYGKLTQVTLEYGKKRTHVLKLQELTLDAM